MQAEVVSVLWPYVTKALIGLAVTGLGALLMYPYRALKKEWAGLKAQINTAQAELVHQRTNCLSTLQDQGRTQIELLGRCAETLEAMHLDQKETLGLIKGSRL